MAKVLQEGAESVCEPQPCMSLSMSSNGLRGRHIPSSPNAATGRDLRHTGSFNEHLSNTYGMPGTKLGPGDPTVNKTDVVYAATELIFCWRRDPKQTTQ